MIPHVEVDDGKNKSQEECTVAVSSHGIRIVAAAVRGRVEHRSERNDHHGRVCYRAGR